MKYISEFRNTNYVRELSTIIHKTSKKELSIMEVCGSHTMAIHRFGIKDLLPKNIKLLSGPGCPVCVTAIDFIDKAVVLAKMNDNIITTFGDLIKVPGSYSTLEKEKALGADIRIVYSVLESIDIAITNPQKHVVFLAIGFETTTPATAAGIIKAEGLGLKNFSVLSAHKIMPPPMQAIIEEGINIDGFLAPGHVSVITGIEMYQFIPEKFNRGVVVSGFEPVDVLQSIYMLVKQMEESRPKVEIQYTRVVKADGNPKAQAIVNEVFNKSDAKWRGLGLIPASALKIKDKYEKYNAEKAFNIPAVKANEPKGCICGQVLKGLNQPSDCKLFRKACTPEHPVGTCMVSSEGACNVFYRYSN